MDELSLVPALSEDARMSHLIAEGIPNMVWTAAADGALEFFNSRVFEYTGMDAEALKGWGWRSVIHADDWDRCERIWRRSLTAGEPYRIEYRIRRGADGAYRWHLGAALPLRDPDGRVAKWFGTCTDIEDQKLASELIRARQASLEVLADERLRDARERERELNEAQRLACIGSWEWDVATEQTRWSAEMFRIFGLDPARGPPETARHPDLYTEESWARVRAAGLRSLATGESYELELEARLPGGGTRWTLSRAECVRDAVGKAVLLRGTVQDIAERHRLEQELRERDAQASLAMETAQMAHWSWRAADRRVEHSEGMGPLFGLPRETRLERAKDWIHVIHPEDRNAYLDAMRTAFRSGDPLHLDWRTCKPDGSIAWLLTSARTVPDVRGAPAGMVGVVMNITERRAAQQGLQRYSDRVRALLHRLVEAQESERRRLATALHDLIGQNLTALNLGLDILRADLHASANLLIGDRIESMTRNVGETVDAIRGVMTELHPALLDDYGLVPALHAHAERFRVLIGIPVGIEAPPDLPRLARPVELAMYRIVQEALTNVAKHSGATRAVVRIAREGGHFTLSVEDNGRGFAEREGARTLGRGGWGLPAMRERAEAFGGTLMIRFPTVGGTRVVVELEAPNAD